jgi:hypothetical protein
MAAMIRIHSLASEAWKAWAVPMNSPRMEAGRRICSWALLMAVTASPRATPTGRLKVRVTEGSWPWWFTAREVFSSW